MAQSEIQGIRMKRMVFWSIALLLIYSCSNTAGPEQKSQSKKYSTLWKQGAGKYKNYRIPSIIVTSKGSILAFCEGREAGDTGDIDLLLKRSEDHGKTWSEEILVAGDSTNTCGNPCPVVDSETGRIWLFSCWNHGEDDETELIHKSGKARRLPCLCYSDDDGLTWSDRVDMSESCRDTSWGWYATGPGIGIQIRHGPHKGRLVIPANHSYDDPEGKLRNGPYGYGSHVLYSDDHGETWQMSEAIKPGCNESQVTELSDGSLLINMRSYNNRYTRAVSRSRDGGKTWSEIEHDDQLVESQCQASILNFGQYNKTAIQLFSNPAVPLGRTAMTVRTSTDDCHSWSNSKLIYAGPAAYSCLAKLPNGEVGLLFEAGQKDAYEKLVFVAFDPKELFVEGALLKPEDLVN